MRLSQEFFYTLRENANDEDSLSSNLLVKAGYIKKVSNGVYAKLPLAWKTHQNITEVVRKHMNRKLATECAMPVLLPMDMFEKSNRKDAFGNLMFQLEDRYGKQYALGPTDEEMFAIASINKVRSYKDLPYIMYQITTKFRDEIRPRLGLIRTREFTMKDAYSFDKDFEGLDESYKKMFDAYNDIFTELGINYTVVKADTGAMGGILSEEFQAITDIGEDILVLCDKCDYSSNLEITPCISNIEESNEEKLNAKEMIKTPNMQSIQEVSEYLNIDIKKTVKALLMNIDNELVILFIRGDRELNETKVLKLLKAKEISFADDELISKSNAVPGYTGPIDLNCKTIVDDEVLKMKNFCCGANKEDHHYINANIEDLKYDITGDIKKAQEGDICPNCGEKLIFKKGIEVGNTFKLGTKYAESMGLEYLDKDNKRNPVVMGSYGIGIERIISAIIEQNNDEKGIIWPINVAPYKVAIVVINPDDEKQLETGNSIYEELNKIGIDTLIDDRKERAGVKFNDIDLIGIPIRITIGNKVKDDIIEIKRRIEQDPKEIAINKAIDEIKRIIENA